METWQVVVASLTTVSILWNIGNTFYTANSNRRNKARVVNLEEFRSRVRDPLEDVFRRSEAVVRELEQLSKQHEFSSTFEQELISKNRELAACLIEIQDGLTDADESRFSNDINWLDLFDPAQDGIFHHMNGVLDAEKSIEERQESMRQCRSRFRKFKKDVLKKIEDEVSRLSY